MCLPRCAYLRAGVTALAPGKWFYIFTFTLSFTLTFTFTLGFQIQNQWFPKRKTSGLLSFQSVRWLAVNACKMVPSCLAILAKAHVLDIIASTNAIIL
jgi:hypothetical protein